VSESYYGRPIVKPHVWTPLIPWYFWIGGVAGAASVQCVAARARGEHELATVYRRTMLAAVLTAPVLLIADLGVPSRFYAMLRVFKPTSPMSVGSWILTAFGGLVTTSTLAELLGWKRTSRITETAAAVLGPPLTVYTAVLIADTATPVWHEAAATLPFVFAASGLGGAAAIGTAFAPASQTRLPRRLMTIGALAMPIAARVMEKRLGRLLAEPYRTGKAGKLRRASEFCSLAGAALSFAGGANRTIARAAAGCVAVAGILERFAILEAGTQSARNPKYVVQSQRERLARAT
jgi:formate-dependent nitrite reductase membrane component NrfD